MNFESIKQSMLALDWHEKIWGNTLSDYIVAFLVLLAFVLIFKFVQWVLLRKLAKMAEKTKTDIDDTLIVIIQSLKPGFYYFVAFYFASKFLTLSGFVAQSINTVLLIWVVFQGVIALQILIDYVMEKKFADLDGDGEADNGIVSFMAGMVKSILWVVALLMILSNLGVNVTGLMAGLGIGGLAIAFALQGVFADLFSAFSIYLDKPFKVGDYIVVGEYSGNIEKIGIKSTRLRALQGEEIIISNQELTTARIHNFKKLEERRITTQFGVIYDTPQSKLVKIPNIIKKIVDEEALLRFGRAYFTTFGDSALLFDLVYHVKSDQYEDYLKAQQNMNFKLKEVFEEEGIEMAFPTQTIYLNKS